MSENTTHGIDSVGIWGGGFTGGLVGGIAMGLVLHLGANQIELLGGLVPGGGTAVAVGWTFHLIISVLFGLVFATLVSRTVGQELLETFIDYVIAGLAFGALLGLFAGGVLFPVAMAGAGVETLPLPFLPIPGIAGELVSALLFALGHLVYGLILGAVFAAINGVTPAAVERRTPLKR
ncbi:SLC5/6 family protein [Natronorubrum thiooxidans]|uniref:Uncharacterized protein n=1 Tax=Natronorubrum thiooxidans TaxID=308853 RepID=A0A1N7C423_9EURY|nr:hypothetical protein [Natronorubrum thiooxidans]SIR58328.1 hypothetical protein SAMN05421752_101105 [Natronorubrum thiooxidans]